jgi:hypothetical protein
MARVIVSVADSHLAAIDQVARQLQTAGLTEAKVLRAAGVVVGEFDGDSFAPLAAVEGVGQVERQRLLGL